MPNIYFMVFFLYLVWNVCQIIILQILTIKNVRGNGRNGVNRAAANTHTNDKWPIIRNTPGGHILLAVIYT